MQYTKILYPAALFICLSASGATITGQFELVYTETTEDYRDSSMVEDPCEYTAFAPQDYGECTGSGPLGTGAFISIDLNPLSGIVSGGIDTGELFFIEGPEVIGRASSAGSIYGQFTVRGNYFISGSSGQVDLWNLLFADASGVEGLTELLVEVNGNPADIGIPFLLSRGQMYNIALFGFLSTYGSLGNGTVNTIQYEFSEEVNSIPEPGTGALVGVALAIGLAVRNASRRR